MVQVEAQKHAVIRKLSIRRYRGFETLEWRPGPTMNLILGGGDVGKTTILDAVGLLLSASNATAVSETDYWRRDNTAEFSIEGVVSLPDGVGPNNELAGYALANDIWPRLEPAIMPLLNAILKAIKKPVIESLDGV
jgi:hypothetical protein